MIGGLDLLIGILRKITQKKPVQSKEFTIERDHKCED
jgi:hypothetical protein